MATWKCMSRKLSANRPPLRKEVQSGTRGCVQPRRGPIGDKVATILVRPVREIVHTFAIAMRSASTKSGVLLRRTAATVVLLSVERVHTILQVDFLNKVSKRRVLRVRGHCVHVVHSIYAIALQYTTRHKQTPKSMWLPTIVFSI
jgi:hypothetical protein